MHRIADYVADYDPTFTLEYLNNWSSYEESGWMAIVSSGGAFYMLRGGCCVMADPYDTVWADRVPIMEDHAINEIIEFDIDCDYDFFT